MQRLNPTRIAIRALNAVAPKRPQQAVLYGIPPLNDGVVALLAELPKRNVRCYVFVDTSDEVELYREYALELGAADVLCRRSRAAIARFVTARYVFLTHMLYPVRPNRRQRVVNIWHGEFTKRIDGRPVARSVHGAITTATSRLGAALRAVEFDVAPTNVLLVGNPRSDRLLGTTKAEARARLGLAANTTVLLWLPTYRARADGPERPPSPTTAELQTLESWLTARDATLVVKHHPLVPRETEPEGFSRIRHMYDGGQARPVSVAELMAAADGLLTDFSSAWVDFLLLDRPIFIHWPDHLKWSQADHNPLTPVENWLPGPLSTDIDGLVSTLSRFFGDGIDDWAERRAWLRPVLHTYVDAHNTERLLDALEIGDQRQLGYGPER